ncbi:uncharacterized, partial [Tachysurus ichikawai]
AYKNTQPCSCQITQALNSHHRVDAVAVLGKVTKRTSSSSAHESRGIGTSALSVFDSPCSYKHSRLSEKERASHLLFLSSATCMFLDVEHV